MTSLRLAQSAGIGIGWVLLLWSWSCMATSAGELSQERRQHVVVVTAERFGAALSGMAVERLSLQAVRDGELTPIPFQIDEINQRGNPYFPRGGVAIAGEEGAFDANDELVFMLRDSGRRIDGRVPASGTLAAELRIDLGEDERFVYLVTDAAERSDERYVSYDVERRRAQTDYYTIEFDPDNHLKWRGLYAKHYEHAETNLIDTYNIRMGATVLTPWTGATITNDNLRPTVRGHKVGPVRAIVQMDSSVTIAGISFPFAKIRMHYFFTEREIHSMDLGEIPFIGLVLNVLYGAEIRLSKDFGHLEGARVRTGLSGGWSPVDGRMDENEKDFGVGGMEGDLRRPETLRLTDNYLALETDSGFAHITMLQVYPESIAADSAGLFEGLASVDVETPTLFGVYYRDDAGSGNGSGRIPGHSPELGYRIVIDEALVHALDEAGINGSAEARFSIRHFILPSFGADGPDGFERQVRNPPAVAVTPL